MQYVPCKEFIKQKRLEYYNKNKEEIKQKARDKYNLLSPEGKKTGKNIKKNVLKIYLLKKKNN